MKKFLVLLILVSCISIIGQTDKNISKDRFNYLVDSLITVKSELLKEKGNLITEIDSLKNELEMLEANISSSRINLLVKKYGKENGARIAKGQIWKGMTEKMLEDSWGKPDKITKNQESWGLYSQWYYGEITYFFKNGEMIGWEQ